MNQLEAIDLAPVRHAPRLARTFAAETLARWPIGVEDVETVRLVVSELVTNAVRHAPTSQRTTVELSCHDDMLRVTVSDGSAAPPERGELTSSTAEDGRGIGLVDALADRWGTEPWPGGKVIWCELRASPRVEV
jgi:anti-sigma regulatory factor (Ser/Thr protein kinase)